MDDPAPESQRAMILARRLYFYVVSSVSLVSLSIGLINLLELAIGWTWDQLGGSDMLSGGTDDIRRQLSVHVALVIVSLPVWLFHWLRVERSIDPARVGESADAERASGLRALYLAAAIFIPFVFWAVNLMRLAEHVARRAFDVWHPYFRWSDGETPASIVIVTGGVWAYHLWARERDERAGPIAGAGAWLPNVARLGAAATGALMAAFGVAGLLALIVVALVGRGESMVESRWWASAAAESLALALAGVLGWLVHWLPVLRLRRNPDWRLREITRSAPLFLYLYGLALFGALAALLLLGASLQDLLRLVIGGTEPSDPTAQRLLEPVARAVPFVALWAYHGATVLRVPTSVDSARAALSRVYVYALAFVGLAVGSYGVVAALELAIDSITDARSGLILGSGFLRDEVSRVLAFTIVGVGAWLWHWRRAQRARDTDPDTERSATPRRAYLLATIAATVIALLVSLAVIVYRVIAALLGVSDAGDDAQMSVPVSVALVGGALLAYHGLALRADLESDGERRDQPVTLSLTVTAPVGASEREVVERVRQALPEGYEVRIDR